MGMQDIFKKIEAHDGVKTAAQHGRGGGASTVSAEPDEAVKTAMFYEDVGRQLAHQVFDDLVEQAGEEDRQTKVAAVLDRIASDPTYAAALVKKYPHLIGR